MFLGDIQREYDYCLDLYKKNHDAVTLVQAEIKIYIQVLKAIARGQCQRYPPEDFAQELLRVFGHEI